jgi:transitional endoplasmic reticulum ATPase
MNKILYYGLSRMEALLSSYILPIAGLISIVATCIAALSFDGILGTSLFAKSFWLVGLCYPIFLAPALLRLVWLRIPDHSRLSYPVIWMFLAPILIAWSQWGVVLDVIVLCVGVIAYSVLQRMLAVQNVEVFSAAYADHEEQDVGRRATHPEGSRDAEPQKAEQEEDHLLIPSVNFASIVGMDAIKGRLGDAAREIIASQDRRAVAPRNGILLSGEPGNGKSFFAEALAGELNLPLMTVTFGDIASKWVNMTTEQVRLAFSDARKKAPCVLFLDEVDSVLASRDRAGNSDSETVRTTNAILTELVAIRKSGVVLVAATNYLDVLDAAAIREGRFDYKVEILPPDREARAALIKTVVRQHAKVRLDERALETAVKRWEGFSVARIKAVAEEAARNAVEGCITYDVLKGALRSVQGRKGRLDTGALGLQDLTLGSSLKRQLYGLAARMREIETTEALGGGVPTGLLFRGEPGTGKTVAAQALALASGWAFLATTGSDLLADPRKIDALVKEARDIRPTVVFIDEADDVLADRRCAPHSASVTNRLLTAIDGAGGRSCDIVWIAATNHADSMDSAALRGGRFGVKLDFTLPDHSMLVSYIEGWMKASVAKFDIKVTPDSAATALEDLSIANVKAILQEAVDQVVGTAVLAGMAPRLVTMADVLEARIQVAGHV